MQTNKHNAKTLNLFQQKHAEQGVKSIHPMSVARLPRRALTSQQHNTKDLGNGGRPSYCSTASTVRKAIAGAPDSGAGVGPVHVQCVSSPHSFMSSFLHMLSVKWSASPQAA